MFAELITPAKAIGPLDRGEVLAVDVRQPEEFDSGHILDAINFPLDTINAKTAAEILPDKNAPLYLYCRSGNRSAQAGEILLGLGYTNLKDLGGLLSWPYELFETV